MIAKNLRILSPDSVESAARAEGQPESVSAPFLNIPVMSFEQPAGVFYLGNMKAADVIRISSFSWRQYMEDDVKPWGSVQREPSDKRIRDIKAYAETVDASFPTPILLSLKDTTYRFGDAQSAIVIDKEDKIAEVVDGQHRLLGLEHATTIDNFQLPVIFLLGATDEQKALIFATVNGKQTKVPASLVYDLFGITAGRSPQKTCHEIAQALNSDLQSPWFKRLKMLGKKVHENESLTQGMFVKVLLDLISKEPMQDRDRIKRGLSPVLDETRIFNKYFCRSEDSTILKILFNIFTAVKKTWPEDWDNPATSVLSRTVGFVGIMNAIPKMVTAGSARKTLDQNFFSKIFQDVARNMVAEHVAFTSVTDFPSSGAGPNNLKRLIEASVDNVTTAN